MARRLFVAVAVAGIAVAGFFMIRNLRGDTVYYLTPSEATARRAEFPDGRHFRMVGIVVPGTLSHQGDVYTFSVTDGGSDVPVTLTGTPPPLFKENVSVLLDGHWDGNRFDSDQALVRHDENYKPPPITPPTTLSAAG